MPLTFDQAIGEHRRANVEGEIAAILGAFTDSMVSAIAEGDFGAMRGNLDGLTEMLEGAVPKWTAGEGVLKRVPVEPIEVLRDRYDRLIREAGEDPPEETIEIRKDGALEASRMLKTRGAVVEAIGIKAEEIARRDGVSVGVAKVRAWEELPHLADRYHELPREEPKASGPVSKQVGPAGREADREAKDLMKKHPGKYGSIASARAAVYRMAPDLADRVRDEQRTGGAAR